MTKKKKKKKKKKETIKKFKIFCKIPHKISPCFNTSWTAKTFNTSWTAKTPWTFMAMTTPKPSRFFNKTGQTGKNGSKDVCIMLPLKHLSTFWRTLKMPLINCEINLFQN